MKNPEDLSFFVEDRKVAHIRLPEDYPNRQHSFELSHVELRKVVNVHPFYEKVSQIAADSYLFEPEIPEVL